jgi:glycosyltransferase involved in cell wall biosynthesis
VLFYDHIPPIPHLSALAAPGAGGPVITYAGNFEPYQGIGMLLEALPEIFRASAATCLFIGGEPAQVAAYASRAEELGISGRVKWAGKLDLEETFLALQASAVLVSPMVEDKAVPSKVYMYMAAGRPIVATDMANQAAMLRNGAALVVRPEPAALGGAILKVLSDKSLGADLSARSRSLFSGISGSTDLAASLESAYGFRGA